MSNGKVDADKKRLRIFTASVLTETCTFSPLPTKFEDFETAASGKLLGGLVREVMNAFRAEAERADCIVVEGLAVGAMPAGKTTASAYLALKTRLLADLDAAGPVDAAVLFLHGAMVADGEDDCEGDILAEVRRRVGADAIIGLEIDPHAHLSERMVTNADIIVAFKEWPHTDICARAEDVMRLSIAAARQELRPCMAVWDCRMIDFFHTFESPMIEVVDQLRDLERSGAALSASIIHGYPFGDTADTGTKTLVVTNGDIAGAARLAERVGHLMFALRGRARPQHLSLHEGVDAIAAAIEHPVVVADAADAPGGGATGDETYLLQALRQRAVENVAIAYVHDRASVDKAFRIGVGSDFKGIIGRGDGACGAFSVHGEVVGLFADAHVGGGEADAVGDVALIRDGGFEILLSRDRPVALHAGHFEAFGIEPRRAGVLIVKSVNNFKAGFESVAAQFIYVAGPGALDTTLNSLVFKKIIRPKWPLDSAPFGAI